MEINIKAFHGDKWLTLEQFKAWLEGRKCSHCENKAKWFPSYQGIAYCDEHYPYFPEKIEREYQEDLLKEQNKKKEN